MNGTQMMFVLVAVVGVAIVVWKAQNDVAAGVFTSVTAGSVTTDTLTLGHYIRARDNVGMRFSVGAQEIPEFTEVKQSGITYDSGTHLFTVVKSGMYDFTFTIEGVVGNAAQTCTLTNVTTGRVIFTSGGEIVPTGGSVYPICRTVTYLEAGDEFGVTHRNASVSVDVKTEMYVQLINAVDASMPYV